MIKVVLYPGWWCRTFHRKRWLRVSSRNFTEVPVLELHKPGLEGILGAIEWVCLDCAKQWVEYLVIPKIYEVES